MDTPVIMSPEQFEQLLAAARGGATPEPAPGAGLGAAVAGASGAPARVLGLGCGDGGMGPMAAGVYQMLAAGSPRLALAKAYGIPLAPYIINIRATFPDTTTAVVPDVGSDVKITQDTLVTEVLVRTQNLSATANQNLFQVQSDYYFNWQSAIEATLDVMGAPRYAVAARFTPVATLADAFNGSGLWPNGWVLTYQQQLKATFQAKVTLPTAPYEVVLTFRAWVPVWDELVHMTNREALRRLVDDCGFVIDPSYERRTCR